MAAQMTTLCSQRAGLRLASRSATRPSAVVAKPIAMGLRTPLVPRAQASKDNFRTR